MYDKNSDGVLEFEEIRLLLIDVLNRKNVNQDDVRAILNLIQSKSKQFAKKE